MNLSQRIMPTLHDQLSRRVGSAHASAALAADLDDLSKPINPVRVYPYPAGHGVSPRPAPKDTSADEAARYTRQIMAAELHSKSYKPAHGGYPGTPVLRNPQPFC